MTETSPPPPPPPPVSPPPPPPAWHDGIDAELLGHAQNKAWKLDDPKQAFTAAATAHRDAQKLIGVPETELLRMPKPSAPPAEIDAFWHRVGAPKEAKDLDLSTVKTAAGGPLDEKLAEVIRATAVTARVPKDAAVAVAAAIQKHFDSVEAQQKTILAGNIATEKAALDQSWGANREANEFVAKSALAKLAAAANLPAEKAQQAWDALSKVGGIGAASAMEMLRVIGARMGEDRFVGGGQGGSNLPMTREAAMAEITALKGDPQFSKRYAEGGVEERKQMDALHKIAYARSAA